MKNFYPFAGRTKVRSWFWWGITLGISLAILVWWWLENQSEGVWEKARQVKPLVLTDDEPDDVSPSEPRPAPQETVEPDDLKKIEGIGPKTSAALREAGIMTFAQLAQMQPAKIKTTLTEAGVRIGFPETWPEQAALAAAGKWEKLTDLQSTLKGGRRV